MSALIGASAPGKLMVSGEYAVLEGAVAVVASVNARVVARWVKVGSASLPPEATEARRLAEAEFGAIDAALTIDASALRSADMKLGLGSSAAAAAAAAGAVAASNGRDLEDPSVQRRVFELALAGHKAIAPEGSGADVAAAALGGFVRFQLSAGGKDVSAEAIAFPTTIAQRVVWTGKEARTSAFIRAVRKFEADDPRGYGLLRDDLRDRAQRFVDAIARGDVREIIAATGAYGLGMGQLGRAADVPIVTAELAQIARLAEAHGGAAKPSGAGGGDVAIAFFPDETLAAAFDSACGEARLARLDLTLGTVGVRAA